MSHLVLRSHRVTFSFRCNPSFDYIPSKSAEGRAQRPFQRKKALRMQHQDLDLSHSHLPVSLLGDASRLQGTDFGQEFCSHAGLCSCIIKRKRATKEAGERKMISLRWMAGEEPRGRQGLKGASKQTAALGHFFAPKHKVFVACRRQRFVRTPF